MAGGQDVSMTESFESKFDVFMNAINALTTRLAEVEGRVAYNVSSTETTTTKVHQPFTSVLEEVVPPVIRQDTLHV